MFLRSILLAGAAIPIVVATVLILTWWLAVSGSNLSIEAILRMTSLGAFGGAVAVGLAAWMYRFARRLADRLDRLSAMARESRAKPEASVASEDGLDAVAGALAGIKDIEQRNAELATSLEEVRESRQRAESVADLLRRNEVRVADCLERLNRAERAVSYRSRAAVLGQLFAGICRDFSEHLAVLLAAGESAIVTVQLTETARDLQHRMRLYAHLAGRRVPRPETFPLRELLDETVLVTEPRWKSEAMAQGKTLRMAVSCPGPISVHMDRFDLMEILIHLIDNAMEAMPMGGTIVLEANRTPEGAALLTVHDQGEGMGEETLRVCCEPFFSTREDAPGMGLAVVSALARRNAVRFGIRSSRGRGATALLELPVGRGKAFEVAAPAVTDVRPLLILAVDDSAYTTELIAHMLEPDGHVVDACADARQALDRLSRRPYDVLMLDRAMPHVSGVELARAVKAARPELPVIMLTGFAELMESAGDTPREIDHLLGKPFTRGDLARALAATCGSR
jgi:signal transduction histidine kinase